MCMEKIIQYIFSKKQYMERLLTNITTKMLISNKVLTKKFLTKKIITIFAFYNKEKRNDYDRKSI